MNQKYLRPFRIITATVLLILTSSIFLDIREHIPIKLFNIILFPQFTPSLLKFIKTLSWMSVGFIFIILLSLLFGRIYCSFLCPLGIFQDIISFFSKKFKFLKRYKFSKAYNYIRYSLLGLTIIFLFFNIIFFVTLLDPYSNFGRIMNGLIRPSLILGNNLLAIILEKLNIYYFSPLQVKTNLLAIIFPISLLLILIWFAGKRGRLFCNTICPIGTFLGIISKFSIYKIKINKDTCISCGKCSFACKSECISIKDKSVDFTRCVGCMNCITTCETNDIQYQLSFGNKNITGESNIDKRIFFKKTVSSVLLYIGITEILKSQTSAVKSSLKKFKPSRVSYKKSFNVTPPGSESHEHFNNTCTACHLCISVCPTKVLQPATLQYGLKGFMQPHMDYSTNYCNYECTRCSETCPTGAILPLQIEEKKTKQLGKVIFIKDNCVVYTENTACGSCAEHCPTKAVHMIPYKDNLTIPETNQKICIGCGACEYACPMRPFKAIYVDGNDVHQLAEKPVIEKIDNVEMDDFPF